MISEYELWRIDQDARYLARVNDRGALERYARREPHQLRRRYREILAAGEEFGLDETLLRWLGEVAGPIWDGEDDLEADIRGPGTKYRQGDRVVGKGAGPGSFRGRLGIVLDYGPGPGEYRVQFDDGRLECVNTGWIDRERR